MNTTINFPNLGFQVDAGKSISIFGIDIAFYGVIIAAAMLVGFLIVYFEAKRTKQNPDTYLDFVLWMAIPALLGARLYYVLFEWDYYGKHLDQLFNTRGGGMAIYGGIIASVITLAIFARVRKLNILRMLDTAVLGLVIGQCIGRWGNFFNREAYGGFTDGLFAMQIPVSEMSVYVRDAAVTTDGVAYIQVHPTFLYESFGCLCIFIFLMFMRKRKKFNGEMIAFYMVLYGILRFIIEGLRTDQLKIGSVAVSQILSAVIALAGLGYLIFGFVNINRKAKAAARQAEKETIEETREYFDEEETLDEQEHEE